MCIIRDTRPRNNESLVTGRMRIMNDNYYINADIAELNLPKTCQLDFPDPDDLLNFKLIICPDEVSITVDLHVPNCTPII